MSLHEDLLNQAEQLAKLDSRRPKQANLRRSISASYYALFHLLTSEASALYAAEFGLAARINRTYGHADMKKVSDQIASDKWPKGIISAGVGYSSPPDLKLVAKAFVELQQMRHKSDYHLAQEFGRKETLEYVQLARRAFAAWERVRRTDDARIYLACFLPWDRWDKPPR